jgi:hypothetical protein
MPIRIEVTIKDTMAFWNNALETHTFNPNGYCPTNTYVFEVPDAWIADGVLTAAGLERVFVHLYGPSWRVGNEDGSKYIVLESSSRVLAPDDTRAAKPITT